LFFLSTIVIIVTKQSVGGILTERDSQISLQASMPSEEKQLLKSSIERPLSWYRSIDDVDMRWTQSDEELQNFLSRTNNLHPSIKFTQRFVGGANSPDSKSLTVWYALSHMRRMTAARKKVLIGVGRFGV
jgi:hypothetical protein